MEVSKFVKDNLDTQEMLSRSLQNLVKLYADPVHFVYELIQNAEDAGATRIAFVLTEHQLEVLHDGRPFTVGDLKRLCDVGVSAKPDEPNAIGKFGIGFKSVFTICDEVYLYSDPTCYAMSALPASSFSEDAAMPSFAVRIRDFVVPEDIPFESLGNYTTKFVFPLVAGRPYSSFQDFDKLWSELGERLAHLGASTLLFLRHIQSIEYKIDFREQMRKTIPYGIHSLETLDTPSANCRVVSATGRTHRQKEEPASAFIVFSRPLTQSIGRTVDIAFPIEIREDGTYRFIAPKEEQRNVFLYFPTDTPSNLNFIIQGPYQTPPTRATISPTTDNIELAKETAELLHESILKLRDLGWLNVDLLRLLPFSGQAFDVKDLFRVLHTKTVTLFQKESILPKEGGGYIDAAHAKLAETKALATLFAEELLTDLVHANQDYAWVTTLISIEKEETKELYAFLRNHGHGASIDSLTPPSVCSLLKNNPGFLPRRDNAWLVGFYNLLAANPGSFSVVGTSVGCLNIELFKTDKDTFVAAKVRNEGKHYEWNLFLPVEATQGELSNINLVHPELYAKCKSFFEDVLHLERPNTYELLVARLKQWYTSPRKAAIVSDKRHIDDIKGVLRTLRDPELKDNFACTLRPLSFLRCHECGHFAFKCPSATAIFLPRTEDGRSIQDYLEGIVNDVSFLDMGFYRDADLTFEDFRLLGVRTDCVVGLNEKEGKEKKSTNTGRPPRWHVDSDFRPNLSIIGLENALAFIHKAPTGDASLRKSIYLLRTLFVYEPHLQGDCIDSSDSSHRHPSVARVIATLRDTQISWLFNKNEMPIGPKGLYWENLSTYYGKLPLYSNVYTLLGFSETDDQKKERLRQHFDRIVPQDQRRDFLDIVSQDLLGRSFDELETLVEEDAKRSKFVFPTRTIPNWDRLRAHAKEVYRGTDEVIYEQRTRSVRRSPIPKSEIRAYLEAHYQIGRGHDTACQLCHRATSDYEACQLFVKPHKDLPPLHLALCPHCATKFRRQREGAHYATFIESLRRLQPEALDKVGPFKLPLGEQELWFTQLHVAEIVAFLSLMGAKQIRSAQHDDP